jgi:hypothetical protein
MTAHQQQKEGATVDQPIPTALNRSEIERLIEAARQERPDDDLLIERGVGTENLDSLRRIRELIDATLSAEGSP